VFAPDKTMYVSIGDGANWNVANDQALRAQDPHDAELGREAHGEVLRGIANGLKALPDKRFLVEGHTCDLGEPDFNLRLSCLRAEAVCGWLIRFGVPPAQLQPMGFGPAEPLRAPDPALSQTANEPLRAQNRRATFRLLME
jgi:outer membrane protein OmpA-like peptidoglycan-associated protein